MQKGIKLLLLLAVLFCCCSKSSSDVKTYRTVVCDVLVFPEPNERNLEQIIGIISFKEKVEIVDRNEVKTDDYNVTKIKYKNITGYVWSKYLSEKSDIPFVDKVKYNYTLNEFEYDSEKAINLAKKAMVEYNKINEPLSNEYYSDDPQIYSFHGKNCNGEDENYILVIMISKLHKDFNHYITLYIDNKGGYGCYGSGTEGFQIDSMSSENIKNYIEYARSGGICP
ncbi:MAG: hypothetical protein FWG92_03430 [Leptospirales bacterium]|nr:hypothetical protein [Leptospirales bacterium]